MLREKFGIEGDFAGLANVLAEFFELSLVGNQPVRHVWRLDLMLGPLVSSGEDMREGSANPGNNGVS